MKLLNYIGLYSILFLIISGYINGSPIHSEQNNESNPSMNITKAIVPAAGLGTRFLTYTKAVPKEMLPLINKPAIQNIVEEGLASGISDFLIIANDDKQAIIDHFSPQPRLEAILQERDKTHLIQDLNDIIQAANFTAIAQPEPLGLGHAVLMAKDAIDNEYFGIFLPDDIIDSKEPGLQQLINVAQKYNASVIAVMEVPMDCVSSYGVVAYDTQLEDGVYEITELVEKPPVDQAPSNLAIIGRYVLSPKIFDSLEKTQPGAGGEIQLTDGIADMMLKGERVLAYKIKGNRYDIGKPRGWLKANIAFGMKDPECRQIIEEVCKEIAEL